MANPLQRLDSRAVHEKPDAAIMTERNFTVKTKRTDSELLDGLEKLVNRGDCPGIINDDKGHWAVSGSGMQSIQPGPGPDDVDTSFHVQVTEWKPTIREAIEAYRDEAESDE